MLINTIPCPDCKRKLRGFEPMDHATTVLRRTCPKCGQKWTVVATPLKVADGVRYDKLEWNRN